MQQRMVQGRDLLGRKQPKITPKRAEDGLREGCRHSAAAIKWLQKLGLCPTDRHNGLLIVRPEQEK